MMKIEKDIGIWHDVLTNEECAELVSHYETLTKLNLSFTRLELRDAIAHAKSDTAAFLLEETSLKVTPDQSFLNNFLRKFWTCYEQYAQKYSVLLDSEKKQIRSMKLQKTLPGEGYHMWHYESDSQDKASRICAWGIYLNTIEQGGETEFLYQGIRISATQGTLAIWPAGYTHTHRGNPPLSGEKYLLTGWVEF
jgi:hypothetical protein